MSEKAKPIAKTPWLRLTPDMGNTWTWGTNWGHPWFCESAIKTLFPGPQRLPGGCAIRLLCYKQAAKGRAGVPLRRGLHGDVFWKKADMEAWKLHDEPNCRARQLLGTLDSLTIYVELETKP